MAHNECNLNYRKPQFLPVFIHNLKDYDTHLFITMFGYNKETIKLIPNNEEWYISYTVKVHDEIKLRFLDSCRFMASSLDDTLAKNLLLDKFLHTTRHFFPHTVLFIFSITTTELSIDEEEKLSLIIKKGIYP